jgi:hypothetical protein
VSPVGVQPEMVKGAMKGIIRRETIWEKKNINGSIYSTL